MPPPAKPEKKVPRATARGGSEHRVRKALGEEVQTSNAIGPDEVNRIFSQHGALDPPYSPETLGMLFENSSLLRQNIDAYKNNIDGLGHRFEPIIDLDQKDANDRIAQAIYLERTHGQGGASAPMPSDEEVAQRKKEITLGMRAEKSRLTQFFDFCCEEMSFVGLRRQLREDIEKQGNGYLEVLRTVSGQLGEFVRVAPETVRLMRQDTQATAVTRKVKVSDLAYAPVEKRIRFRKFIQHVEGMTVFFKEYGDPRIVSRKTGRVVPPPPQGQALRWDGDDGPATEILHFRIAASRTSYGVPRWMGGLLAVLGTRQAEEVNYTYFDNKTIPPFAILVSGGRLGKDTVRKLESHMEQTIKGKKNFWKTLILEAVPAGGPAGPSGIDASGRASIELKPLTDAQQKDALFLGYDERNTDKVGQTFRLPRLLRGDTKDFNRATADAAIDFAEQQVFSVERKDFDFIINRRIFAELEIRYWKFESLGPQSTDPVQRTSVVCQLTQAGILTPREARDEAESILGRELPEIAAPWVDQPMALTLAGIVAAADMQGPWTGEEDGLDHGAYGDLDGDGQQDVEPIVTRTALANVVTVDEARTRAGLPALGTAEGGMMVADYLLYLAAQRGQQVPGAPPAQITQGAPKEAGDGAPAPVGTMTTADLPTRTNGRGRGTRRARRQQKNLLNAIVAATPLEAAHHILQIRDAVIDAEASLAAKAFYRQRRAELGKEGILELPDEAIQRLAAAAEKEAAE